MRSVMRIRDSPEELANVLVRQDRWAKDEGGAVNRLLTSDASQPLNPGPDDQRFRWSEAVWWAWLDLNQRPHPYQRWTADRHANQHFRWSCDTVSPTGMG